MAHIRKISPCLWFVDQAEEAARFYTGIFENSRITRLSRYGEAGREIHGREPGTVMAVSFELHGQPFTALNGGTLFRFNGAISFQVDCATQDELDHYWERLSASGDEQAQRCGWLQDRYGVSWQILPNLLPDLLGDADPARAQRTLEAMLGMKKLDIEALKQAHAG